MVGRSSSMDHVAQANPLSASTFLSSRYGQIYGGCNAHCKMLHKNLKKLFCFNWQTTSEQPFMNRCMVQPPHGRTILIVIHKYALKKFCIPVSLRLLMLA